MTDTVAQTKPWESEVDYEYFHHQGVPCAIVRSPLLGHLRAYITVPPTHPWYHLEADKVIRHEGIADVVFGRRDPLPIDRNDKFAILGYNNARDFQPTCPTDRITRDVGEYKTFDWVRNMLTQFAVQAKKVGRINFQDHPLSPWG